LLGRTRGWPDRHVSISSHPGSSYGEKEVIKSMRKIVAGLLMSLDGVVDGTDRWGWPRYMTAEMSRGIMEGIAQSDAVLLGRRTYEHFAKIWPGQGSDVPMADFLNNSPKYVVSSTLLEPLAWANSNLIRGDLREELGRLKAQP